MSIGRDIYCDTRLTLRKLEGRVPNGALGAKKEDEKAIKRLLEVDSRRSTISKSSLADSHQSSSSDRS